MNINEKYKLNSNTYLFGCELDGKKFLAIAKVNEKNEIIKLSTFGDNPIDSYDYSKVLQ